METNSVNGRLLATRRKHETSDRLKTSQGLVTCRLGLLTLVTALLWVGGCAFPANAPPPIGPEQPNVISLKPQNWYVLYSDGVPPHPKSDPLGRWSLDFPSYENHGHLCYVQTPFNATIPLHSVTVVFEIQSSSPQYFEYDPTDKLPPTCRLMIEQRENNRSDPNGRWWADADVYNIGSEDGQILTFNVPFDPKLWGNVEGQFNAAAFQAALSNIGWIGVTFGGQFFAGHGVAMKGGTAKFVLIDAYVE